MKERTTNNYRDFDWIKKYVTYKSNVNSDEQLNWEELYRNTNSENMPWYLKKLDHDLQNVIKSKTLSRGRFLDLGTGPGTQAIELAKLGFTVTGSDLSESAIEQAKKLGADIKFVTDDVLDSRLPDSGFDYIFDRGCFHCLEPSQRNKYLQQIKRILEKRGILFLKCFSVEEKNLPNDLPVERLSKQGLIDIFGKDFEIEIIVDTAFKSKITPHPKALFAIMHKKG